MAKTPLTVAENLCPIVVNLRGKVSYSHISRLVEGEELKRENERRRMATPPRQPAQKPFSALTITDPMLIDDGRVPDIIKQLISERVQTRTNPDGTQTNVWYANNKSSILPEVAYGVEAGADLAGKGIASADVPLEGELATGLDVTIGVKFFKSAMGPGIGMDYVLVNEPIRYYTASALAKTLADQGVTYQPAVAPSGDADSPVPSLANSVMTKPAGVPPRPANPMTPAGAAAPGAVPVPAQAPAPSASQIQEAAAAAAASVQANTQYQQQQAGAAPMVGYPPNGYQPQAPAMPNPLSYNPN